MHSDIRSSKMFMIFFLKFPSVCTLNFIAFTLSKEKNILLHAHVSTVSLEFNSFTAIKTFVPAFIAANKETKNKELTKNSNTE